MENNRPLVQLRQSHGQYNHAGSKAPDDVTTIAGRLGFRLIAIWRREAAGPVSAVLSVVLWLLCIPWYTMRVPFGAVVLLQYPELYFSGPISVLLIKSIRWFRHCSVITLVHDIDELRHDDLDVCEYDKTKTRWMMDLTDVFIVHNSQMKSWFEKRGIRSERIVELGAFDYLVNGMMDKMPSFSRTVVFAGNLSRGNTSFVYDAIKFPDVDWRLFGPNYEGDNGDSWYGGVFAPDELPNKLNSGFGLVWNGNSIETCEGETGRYLRFNYPHKLSLYIAAGLPVIIWNQAAEAKLVCEAGIGIAIGSLNELREKLAEITPDDYVGFQNAAKKLRDKIRSGRNTADAIVSALCRRSFFP